MMVFMGGSIGAILIAGYVSFAVLQDFLLSDEYPAIVRFGVGAATAGGIVLAVAVLAVEQHQIVTLAEGGQELA